MKTSLQEKPRQSDGSLAFFIFLGVMAFAGLVIILKLVL